MDALVPPPWRQRIRGNVSVDGSGEGSRAFAARAILAGGLEGVRLRRVRDGARCRSDPTGQSDAGFLSSLETASLAVIVNVRYWVVSYVRYDNDVIGIEYGIACLPVLKQT